MRKNSKQLYCLFLIGCLESITTQFYYPEIKSSTPYSYTIYKAKKVNETTNMVETHRDYKDCVTACRNKKEMCKSIEANMVNESTSICRFFDTELLSTIQADGFIYISSKLPNCSLSCNLTSNPCGKCKCNPSCAARNRRQYVCNCTLAAGSAKSCQEHYEKGFRKTGIFQINLNGKAFKTVCEMEKVELQNPKDIVLRNIREREVIKNNLVATISLLKMTYSVSFMFKPRDVLSGIHANVIRLTIDGTAVKENFHLYGGRTPSVFFFNTRQLLISSAVNDNWDHSVITNPIPLNAWSSIQITQTQTNGIYMYEVFLNGTTLLRTVNTKPTSFPNVKVFNGDSLSDYGPTISSIKDFIVINGNEYPWYNPLNGFIDVLNNVSKSNVVWIPMMTRFASWESSFWNRSYHDYEIGFGLLNQQWIGLKKLNQITSTFLTDLRVDYYLRKDLAFSTMYYNIVVNSSDNNYMISYEQYDSRGSLEPDLFNANYTTFQNCNNWWTTSCNENSTPTSTNYISYGSEKLLSIQFLLRTKENRLN